MRSRLAPLALALAGLLGPPHAGAQRAAEVRVMRLATLAPRTVPMRRLMERWNGELARRTGGRLRVQVYWGGEMGDERTVVRKMRIGDLDAASLTSVGLSILYRPVLVLQAPGLFETYEQLDAARRQVGPELRRGIEAAGFGLLGLGDSGRLRLFSRQPLRRPRDLRRTRPWVPREDAVFRALLGVVGATGVSLSIGEVFGALRTRMVDVVPATALAVGGLQWFTALRYTSRQSDGFLVGGTVVRRGFLDRLPEGDRRALFESARESRARLARAVRRADERAFVALTRHGITALDVAEWRAEWAEVARRTRGRMRGRIVPAPLLERVERIAAAAR